MCSWTSHVALDVIEVARMLLRKGFNIGNVVSTDSLVASNARITFMNPGRPRIVMWW